MVAAPAIVSERRQRRQNLELAEQRAVIAFQSPDRGQHFRRHAIGLLDTGKQRVVLLDGVNAVRNAAAAEQAIGEIGEGAGEHRLAVVALDDGRVEHQFGRNLGDHLLRDALRCRVAFELCDPGLEAAGVAAGGRGQSRGGDGGKEETGCQSLKSLGVESVPHHVRLVVRGRVVRARVIGVNRGRKAIKPILVQIMVYL